MGISSWGGGIVLGLVAVLWLVYLVPSWAKRQQYLATERNAVRLQQTLRILAQTAELPEEIRVEANAKSVATAQRILRTEEAKREAIRRAQEAARQRAITRELAAAAPALAAVSREPALAARRLRRTRLVATLVLAVSIALIVVGALHFAGSWLMVIAAGVGGVGAVAVLGQLAAVSRARARRAAVSPTIRGDDARVAQPFQDFAFAAGAGASSTAAVVESQDARGDAALDTDVAAREWTPVPMPRPLYLRRGTARALARSSAAAPTSPADSEALRVAAERSAAALREAQERARLEAQRQALREVARAEAALDAQRAHEDAAAPASAPSPAAPARAVASAATRVPSAPASPFARMGYLDEGETQDLRLDEVLQRRRAV